MAPITLRALHKAYGRHTVIHGIDLDIASGEFLVLVGPSGCGKSTLLRMIAGIEEITSGELRIGDQLVNTLLPSDRNIAMVFQDYALYPHMTVTENMQFGLRMRHEAEAEITRRVDAASEALKIRPLMARRPAELSGGQRQRVAMGRAIVREPQAFLFDEPLSNLDASLRMEMRLEMARLHRRMRATTVYVTHDQVEAMTLADRIVVMNAGRIEQIGQPLELYQRPARLFVARFIGSPTMNTLTVPVISCDDGGITCALPAGPVRLPAVGFAGTELTLGIRPEDLHPCEAAEAWFTGELAVVERLGSQTFGHLDGKGGQDINIEFPRKAEIAVGDIVSAKGDLAQFHLFDSATGVRLN